MIRVRLTPLQHMLLTTFIDENIGELQRWCEQRGRNETDPYDILDALHEGEDE